MGEKKLSFLRGGRYYYGNGNLDYRGGSGRYWESKVSSVNEARNLYFGSTILYPYGYDYNNKGNGFSIRCVVQP